MVGCGLAAIGVEQNSTASISRPPALPDAGGFFANLSVANFLKMAQV
jgi:hypothetical protein